MFDIETVAGLTNVPAATLRNWEKRYGVISPLRTEGGHRLYSLEQVLTLKKVAALTQEGHKLSALFELLATQCELPQLKADSFSLNQEHQDMRQRLFDDLSSYRIESGTALLDILHGLLPVDILLDGIYFWIMHKLGEQWQVGALSVATEHMISAILHGRLFRLLASPTQNLNRRALVFACTEGERHEGGLLMLACHMKIRGWSCVYLGTGLPTSELKEVIDRLEPSLVCLSYTTTCPDWKAIAELGSATARICIGGASRDLKAPSTLPDGVYIFDRGGRQAADHLEVMAHLETSMRSMRKTS